MVALIYAANEHAEGALISFNGKTVLEYQLESLARSGVHFALIAHPKGDDSISNALGDGSKQGVRIRYLPDSGSYGVGEAFLTASKIIKEDFVFLYGDLLLDVDFEKLQKAHRRHEAVITALVHPSVAPSDDDILILNPKEKVVHALPKGEPRDIYFENITSSGVYLISRDLLETFDGLSRPVPMDFEEELFLPTVYADGAYGYRSAEIVRRATRENKETLRAIVENGVLAARNRSHAQKAVFLDRDGVINVFGDYVTRPEMLTLKEDAAKAIARLNDSEYLAIVATNQPIVARGEASLGTVKEIHNRMEDLLGEQGTYIDGLYCCPHFPPQGKPNENPEYSIVCECRKPNIGMLKQASKDHNIALNASWFVGDTHQDIQTGINAGCRTILVTSGDPNPAKKFGDAKPDFIVKDLAEAVEVILTH